MKKFIVLIVMMLTLLPTSYAQDDVAVCSYIYGNSRLMTQGMVSFPDCADILLAFAQSSRIGEAYGWWSVYYIGVKANGDIYYADNTLNPEWVFWGNVSPEPSPTPQPTATSNPKDDNWDIRELVEVAAFDINDYWTKIFAQNNLIYRVPTIYLDNYRSVRTFCGVLTAEMGPVYCSADSTIYLPEYFMDFAQDRIGDFAVVVIIAHEWGHHVQSQLGLLHTFDNWLPDSSKRRNIEIEADCLAGAYSAHAAYSSKNLVLDDGDIEEGAIQMFEVGSNHSEIEVWTNPRAHGRPQDRVSAYEVGFTQGVEGCVWD